MSDLDEALKPKRRKAKTKVDEAPAPEVTQEVTETPKVVVHEVRPHAPEKELSPRTLAEIERGRRALAEIAARERK